ncbi:GntR family transcriptional regulator [Alicyclobacillus fastidiosus]|uniref:GntR family transcriptional regulator n=1 Tax=Alicyclobacillus fastidiosus TaxID=392011 RepID=A0ABV5ACD8_9BACL|nr:GntR family transcriptional regulator [Alicyclobacillus fastidiosus]WEH11935.1 GntR family transcriptional regulator [Alicyclobacillus fastidiosus]
MPKGALYLQVYHAIKNAIENGQFQEGEILPTESELMEKFGVSRITTNRALQILASEGIVTRKTGVGTFVGKTRPVSDALRSPDNTSSNRDEDNFPTPGGLPLVGIVVPFLTGTFGQIIVSTTEQILNKRGMSIVLAASYGSQQNEQACIHRLVECGVKGLIVLPVNGPYYNDAILSLRVDRFPVVLVDKSLPGIPLPYVTSDNYGAAKELTDYLISLGHKNIAFYTLPLHGTSTLMDRLDGFTDSLKSHGITAESEYHLTLSEGRISNGKGQQVNGISDFLNKHPEVTAVFAVEDSLAQNVYDASLNIGRKVPDELSIVCFDGGPVKNGFWDFTHVIQDEAEMARHCVRILDDLWSSDKEKALEPVVLPCRIQVAQSTASVPLVNAARH